MLEKQGEYYKTLKATVRGDAVYANYGTGKAILDQGLSFICTGKNESHPWIAEPVEWGVIETRETVWTGRCHLEYRYTWVNGVEHRADGEQLLVKYRYLEIHKREKGKITYNNRWNTDQEVSKEHVKLLTKCARARWKLEHENNNILKNYGYHLEHNFGDGENRAGEVYCILNLLAFLVYGLMIGCDEDFIKACSYFGRREECYKALRTFFWAFEFPSFGYFLLFVIAHARGG